MTAPDPMPLVERLRKTAHAMDWGYATSADNMPSPDVLRKVADEIERLTAALEAEKAEVFRLQASHSALYAEVQALRRAAPAQGVPEGWKLVPVHSTIEMAHAGAEAIENLTREDYEMDQRSGWTQAENAYSAMLAATPPSPAQAAGWRDIESAPRWVVVCETALDVGKGDDVRTGGRPELGYALIADAATFKSEAEAMAAIRETGLPLGWVVMPLSRLLPDLPAAPGHPPSERQGLTKDQIDFILSDSFLAANGSVYSTRVYDFVQAIERAHGIVPATPESAG